MLDKQILITILTEESFFYFIILFSPSESFIMDMKNISFDIVNPLSGKERKWSTQKLTTCTMLNFEDNFLCFVCKIVL